MVVRRAYDLLHVAALALAAGLSGCATPSPRSAATADRPVATDKRPAPVVPAEVAARRPPQTHAQAAVAPANFEVVDSAQKPATPTEPSSNPPSGEPPPPGLDAESTSVAGEAVSPVAAPDSQLNTGTAHAIDLPTVLQLVNGQNPQVLYARERIQEAFAQLDRAQVLWLPSLRAGITYDKHEGPAQQVDGNMITASRTALFSGFGGVLPGAATPAIPGLFADFMLVDAIFQPRIAQRTAASRESAATAATNDALLDAALAYLELLRSEQDLAISRDARGNTQQLAEITGAYAETEQGTKADHDRALAELAVRSNDLTRSEESVGVASSRLAQQLSLDPLFAFEPREPTIVPIELISAETPLADLVARGLMCRPEIAESRHLAAEAVERLKREKYAPLIPRILLGIAYGGFGGGEGSHASDFSASFDSVVGAFWEVRNLGFGERAARDEARSRIQQAQWKEVAALDRVAREVVEAHVQVESRRRQLAIAEEGLRAARSSYDRNVERIRHVQGLPLEVLQSIQALAQAQREYLRVVVSYNEAQFRLQRALGWPAENAAAPQD